MSGGIERQKGVLPGAPSSRVFITGCVDAFIETNANTERRLRGGPAETQGQHEAALASRQANFAGEGYIASERLKRYALKHDVAARIGEHQFFDPITTLVTDTADDKRRHAFGDRMNGTLRIALLFREETMPIGNDEAQIPRACLIDPRIVDLVEDAVAQREPDSALRLQRGTDTAFGARCPSRIAARPPRCSVLEGH